MIDTSLAERYGIVMLLDRLRGDSLTFEDVEEIGRKLQKSGRRALSPLVRRFWSERNSEAISRYAMLLDYFEEEEWMSQLVQIALQRRDLDEEGKAVLLSILNGCGVDITSPPFASLLAEADMSRRRFVSHLLDKEEEGYVAFMEDFIQCPPESQKAMVQHLGAYPDDRVVRILEILLYFDEEGVAGEAISVLGRVRSMAAATILERFREQAPPKLLPVVQRSLRRLSFLGILPEKKGLRPSLSFHAACVTPPDADGHRSLWISRWVSTHRVTALYVQVHETDGMKGGWSSCGAAGDVSGQLREAAEEEGLVPVPVEYVLLLLRDAIARTRQSGMSLPAELYVQRPRLFAGQDLTPQLHEPAPLAAVEGSAQVISPTETCSLLDDEYFAGWFVAKAAVYDLAEEWERLEKRRDKRGLDRLVDTFCSELLSPEIPCLQRRLLLVAELMVKSGREKAIVELVHAAIRSLPPPSLPCQFHPFLRRLAADSINMARESLAEGYDLRDQVEEEDAGDCGE